MLKKKRPRKIEINRPSIQNALASPSPIECLKLGLVVSGQNSNITDDEQFEGGARKRPINIGTTLVSACQFDRLGAALSLKQPTNLTSMRMRKGEWRRSPGGLKTQLLRFLFEARVSSCCGTQRR